jgi:hypothetical protein
MSRSRSQAKPAGRCSLSEGFRGHDRTCERRRPARELWQRKRPPGARYPHSSQSGARRPAMRRRSQLPRRVAAFGDSANRAVRPFGDIHLSDLAAAKPLVVHVLGPPTVERSAGIGQVSQVVTQLGGATRQCAALANRSAEAPASRREQADRLVHSVGAFRLSRACLRWPAVVACPSRPHNRRTVRTRTNHSLKVASTCVDSGLREDWLTPPPTSALRRLS